MRRRRRQQPGLAPQHQSPGRAPLPAAGTPLVVAVAAEEVLLVVVGPAAGPSPHSSGTGPARSCSRLELWFEDEARVWPAGHADPRVVVEPSGTRPTAPKLRGLRQPASAGRPSARQQARREGLGFCQRPALLLGGPARSWTSFVGHDPGGGAREALVWDGAGWRHRRGRRLCRPTSTPLISACRRGISPELNPVERLWLYLREHHWSNRVYEGVGAWETAAESAWRAVCLDPNKIMTVCRCTYADNGC